MGWLFTNLRPALPAPWGAVASILAAVIAGLIMGAERERREKAAGMRTLTLVALGAAAFTMVGFAFAGTNGDSGRVAAQIVTGIGFLGAGVILHPRGTISGATTAAAIWVTASIGMIAGSGYAGAALGMSLLVRVMMKAIAAYEIHSYLKNPNRRVMLQFDPAEGKTRVRLERILADYPFACVVPEWKSTVTGPDEVKLSIHLPQHHLRDLMDDLVSIAEVKSVREQRAESSA